MFGDDHRHNLSGRGKGANAAAIFFLPVPKNSAVSQEWCISGKSGERDVNILRTGSNQSSPSFQLDSFANYNF
jgi:hypothetical protein